MPNSLITRRIRLTARKWSLLRMNEQVRKTLNLCWLPMTAPWLIDQLFAHPERLKSLAGCDRQRHRGTRPKAPVDPPDIPLLDEAMDMLGPDPRRWPASHRRRVVPPKSSMPEHSGRDRSG